MSREGDFEIWLIKRIGHSVGSCDFARTEILNKFREIFYK